MADIQLTDDERKVLSFCYRGITKATAESRIAEFFKMRPQDVRAILEKLKRQGLLIESKSVAAEIAAYQASPIKVRSSMLDQRVIEQVKAMEAGGKAGGFKKRTFDPDTGAVSVAEPKKETKSAKKGVDLGFDIE